MKKIKQILHPLIKFFKPAGAFRSMNTISFLLCFVFNCIACPLLFSQDKNKVDSLSKVLNRANSDTAKVNIMALLFSEYINSDTAKALEYFTQALALAQKAGYNEGMADLYNSYGRYCNETAKHGQAKTYSLKALAIYEDILRKNYSESKNKSAGIGSAISFFNLGYLCELDANYTKAVDYYEKALKIYEKYHRKDGISSSYANLGCVNVLQGDNVAALENFQKSLQYAVEIGDLNKTASCYNNMGIIYESFVKYPEAIEFYQKSEKIYKKIGDKRGCASCYLNISVLYDALNNYSLALDYINKSMPLMKEIGDQNGLAYCYTSLADIQNKRSKNADAIGNYEKALQILEKIGDNYGLANSLNNIGICYENSGDLVKAYSYYKKSMEIKEKSGDTSSTASTFGNIAGLHIRKGMIPEAINFARKSMEIAKRYHLLEEEKDAYYHLYHAYSVIGKSKEALENHILYTGIKDSMFSIEKNKQLTEMETRYQAEKRQLQIDELEKEKILQNEIIERKTSEMQKQRIIIYTFIVGFIIIVIFSAIIYRLFLQKKKANRIITEKNEALQMANEEINSQKEEIETQRDEITTQRDLVTQQKEHIEYIHNNLTDSIRYAERIQKAVLPDLSVIASAGEAISPDDATVGTDYFILFKPKDIVSGDFYWTTTVCSQVVTLNGTTKTQVVAVADCTGHGVPGAFMSMLGISFLNEIVRRQEISAPNLILEELRNNIIESLQQSGIAGEQQDGMDIALCTISSCTDAINRVSTYNLQFAGANNPLYVIARTKPDTVIASDSEAISPLMQIASLPLAMTQPDALPASRNDEYRLIEVKPDKMPIAIYENMSPFTNKILPLKKGDTLYLTSDGYSDQFGGPKGKKFKATQLKERLLSVSQKSMNEQRIILDKTIEDWRTGHEQKFEQTDDITILGIRI